MLFAFFVCKIHTSAKQHHSTILAIPLLCDVEQDGQTNSILLFTPENIRKKGESKLLNFTKQGGTPENKRKGGNIVKHHQAGRPNVLNSTVLIGVEWNIEPNL